MSWNENDLRRALERREAPYGFTERLMARLDEPAPAPVPIRASWLSRPWWRIATAASLAALLSAGLLQYDHQRRERLRAEAARDQLITALELTAGKLRLTRERIAGLGADHHDGASRAPEGRSE